MDGGWEDGWTIYRARLPFPGLSPIPLSINPSPGKPYSSSTPPPRRPAPLPGNHPLAGLFPVNLPMVQLTSQQRTERYGLTEAATSASLVQEMDGYVRYCRTLIQLDRGERALEEETTTGHTSHIRYGSRACWSVGRLRRTYCMGLGLTGQTKCQLSCPPALPTRAFMGYVCRYFAVRHDQASLLLYRDKQTLLYFVAYLKERGVGRDHVSWGHVVRGVPIGVVLTEGARRVAGGMGIGWTALRCGGLSALRLRTEGAAYIRGQGSTHTRLGGGRSRFSPCAAAHRPPPLPQVIKHVAIASRVCTYLDAQDGVAPDGGTRAWMARLITQLRLLIPRETQKVLPPARLVFGHVRSLYDEAEQRISRDAHNFGNDDQIKPDTAEAVQRFIVSSLVSLLGGSHL